MDRILYKEANGDLTCRVRDFDKVFPTLYAYEETGLTPDEIGKLKAERDTMKAVYPTEEEVREAVYKGTPLPMTNAELAMKMVACFGGVPHEARKLVHEAVRRLLPMENVFGEACDTGYLVRLLQAEQEGRLIVLPCPIGTPVYVHRYLCHGLPRGQFNGDCWLIQDCPRNGLQCPEEVREEKFNLAMKDSLGRYFWLTREEAEAALPLERRNRK